MYRLMLGDCLDRMRELESESVDAIVTDPPYGMSNESYDRGVSPEQWAEMYRVAKPGAYLISFAGSPTYHRIAGGIEEAGFKVRQMWGWIYRDGMITSGYPKEGFDRLAPAMDPICYATKGKALLSLEREGSAWDMSGRDESRPSFHRIGVSENTDRFSAANARKTISASGHWPKSVVCSGGIDGFQYFALNRTKSRGDRPNGHPNQKPLSIMEWLISKLPPNLIILDPFTGGGTTGVAAINLGHSFIGFEVNPGYLSIAQTSLAEAERESIARAEAN